MINNGVILSELHIKELNFIVCKDRKISTIKKTRTKYILIELKDFNLSNYCTINFKPRFENTKEHNNEVFPACQTLNITLAP